MLILFRAGPVTDNTANTYDDWDVIDIIPRHKEAVIKARGLGKKDTRLFWVEVDTDRLTDEEWGALAQEVAEPDREEITTLPTHPTKKTAPPMYKTIRKRKKRLIPEELEKLDSNFKKDTAKNDRDAKKIYPKRRLNLNQFRKLIGDKKTGRDLDGN